MTWIDDKESVKIVKQEISTLSSWNTVDRALWIANNSAVSILDFSFSDQDFNSAPSDSKLRNHKGT